MSVHQMKKKKKPTSNISLFLHYSMYPYK